jgi:hypothetical protein
MEPKIRDRLVELQMAAQVSEGLAAQVEFFAKTRPWQSVVGPAKDRGDAEVEELRTLTRSLGWNGKSAWPSVWHMAKACGLEELYRYLYSATSKWVHFSPHVLLRMGWGPGPFSAASVWQFTTKHFARYYTEFNRTYSVYLLLELFQRAPDFPWTVAARNAVEVIRIDLDAALRWPELVTFEELNRRPPNSFSQLLMRVAHEHD